MNYLTIAEYSSKLIPELKFKLRKISHARRIEYNAAGAPIFSRLNEIEREMDPLREEMRRATEAAKIEPCVCGHPKDSGEAKRAIEAHAVFADEIKKEGGAASELTDICHLATSGRCIVPGCECRMAKPDHDADKLLPGLIQKHAKLIHEELYPFRIRFAVKEIQGFDIDGQPATVESFIAEMPDQAIAEIGTEIERVLGLTIEEQLGFKLPTTSGAVETGQNQSTDAPLVSVTVST